MNELIGYACAALIGVSLGLIGGGGSILTMPVLVYLFHIAPVTATSYSLFIVGSTSLVGAAGNIRRHTADLRTAGLFGLSSVVTVLLTRKFLIPHIPPHITTIGGVAISFSLLTMVLFAVLMLFAALSMIRHRAETVTGAVRSRGWLLVYGITVGLVTGFLGAGGGFLLIPALVLILHMDMKTAVGTSLLIIAMNSIAGFLGDIGHYALNWKLLITLTLIAITGILIGSRLSHRISGARLRKGFGWFVLAMAVYILIHELATATT